MIGRALSLWARPARVDRTVYATITLMSVLIIYDGWQHLRFVDVAGVIVGPILAMFLSHVFAGNLAREAELGRSPTRRERLHVVASESRFLLLAVPPLVISGVLTLAGVSLARSINVILWLGVASLGYWGGVAGRRAGYSGWRLVTVVLAGLILGFVVLVLQAFLQPGKVLSGGTA